MTSELPKYRRVYAALRHDILIGKYVDNEKFPSEGMLMRRFAVSRITVRQAMTDLKNEGFLEARSGSGTYLSALARHATGMIGLVIPDYSSNIFFKQLGDELVNAGKSAGYTMLLGELPGNTPGERAHEAIALAQEYARRKVAGAVIESGLNWSDRNILCLSPKDKAAMKKALSKKLAPDAIVCHNDATAAMMPRFVKVAGFDGLAIQGKRKFPTIHQPINLLAKTAITTLLERIRKPDTPPRQVLVNADKITDIETTRSS